MREDSHSTPFFSVCTGYDDDDEEEDDVDETTRGREEKDMHF